MSKKAKNPGFIVVGVALFSMFFGGGNLIFPLWIGSIASGHGDLGLAGFLASGVFLPFLAVYLVVSCGGDYRKVFDALPPRVGKILIAALMLFWIPFGSAPRCINIAYAAYSHAGLSGSLVIYSVIYSLLVWVICYRRSQILDFLGYVVTPLLVVSIGAMIFVSTGSDLAVSQSTLTGKEVLLTSFLAGYNTQDFIAAFFFTGAIVDLIRAGGESKISKSFVLKSGLVGVSLISLIYIGMIYTGLANSSFLAGISKDRLLVTLSDNLAGTGLNWVSLAAITLSCHSTSVALVLVFARFLQEALQSPSWTYLRCVNLTVVLVGIAATSGFESLSSIMEVSMGILYPAMLCLTAYVFFVQFRASRRKLAKAA